MSNDAADKALIEAAKKAAAEKATKWQGVGNEPYIGVDDWKRGGLIKGYALIVQAVYQA